MSFLPFSGDFRNNDIKFNIEDDSISVDDKLLNNSVFDNSLIKNENTKNNIFSENNLLISEKSIDLSSIFHVASIIENYSVFIFEPTLFKKVLNDNNLNKQKDIGLIYNTIKSDLIKREILAFMVCEISQKHFNEKYKLNNENKDIILIDIFNEFLGNNINSKMLYSKILPCELNEIFDIKIILNLREKIDYSNLCVLMQNQFKIYFNDIMNINFENPFPFSKQDIKYMAFYNDNSEYNKVEEQTRINLIALVISYSQRKKYETCIRLSQFYFDKFSNSFSLDYWIYNTLGKIYGDLKMIEESKEMFNKSLNLINWLFPKNNCNIICDTYYEYGLSLIKNKIYKINKNEIMDVLKKSLYFSKIFYEKINREKFLKIFLIHEYESIYSNINDINFENIINALKEINHINKKEGEMLIKLFDGLCKNLKNNKSIFTFYNKIKNI